MKSNKLSRGQVAVVLLLIAVIVAVCGGIAGYVAGGTDNGIGGPEYTGDIILDISDDADWEDIQRIRELAGVDLGTEISDPANLFRIPNTGHNQEVIDRLLSDSDVESAERDFTISIPANENPVLINQAPPCIHCEDYPNNPMYEYQWHMNEIQMPSAWRSGDQGAGVVVAVIDTGVAYGGELPQAPDLANTTFVPGYDFIDNDEYPDDYNGHGTHCAGTVAQSTNNAYGVTGVAPGVAIMPVRVLSANGSGTLGGVAAGIRWAAEHGADVISMSLGSDYPANAIINAVNFAHSRGVVIVAAAGNDNRPSSGYPAGHDHVISVGATNAQRTRAWYSNYGEALDIVAPGGDSREDRNGDGMVDGVVQETIERGDPYNFGFFVYQGTSMATPHAAAVAALIVNEGVDDPDEVEDIMTDTALDLGDDYQYAAGLVQTYDAIQEAHSRVNGGDFDAGEFALDSAQVVSLSCIPFLALIMLGYGYKRARTVLGSICAAGSIGLASAMFFPSAFGIPPFQGWMGWLVIGWLLINSLVVAGLAWLVLKKEE